MYNASGKLQDSLLTFYAMAYLRVYSLTQQSLSSFISQIKTTEGGFLFNANAIKQGYIN